ncbi:NAD-dependent succinate-semialdehyde dehydrogenase [Actinomadura madurae]|uniref:NAD-dependent succinate-semialdehyde dehydrogenase n=1 Tax=Actinomadura madurae TaxID=1993 RepID=UPI00202757F8|nr:NAD-dependent succinate-semialdehyde dehydrogenase [Actinomadura madurae]URN01009.1 NAD-dependent succinate-semialdehyde dehydrogenase [Actinomadura madurae]
MSEQIDVFELLRAVGGGTRAATALRLGDGWEKPASGEVLAVIDPATERELGTVADATPDDARAALDVGAAVAGSWAATAPRFRAEVLRRTYEITLAEREPLARLITAENGKSLAEARAEIDYSAEFFRWYSSQVTTLDGEFRPAPSGDNHILVSRHPIGPSVLVTPWNFPSAMAARKLAPAIGAGCTAVLKPAPETPFSAIALAAVLERAGLPPGVVTVVSTSDAPGVVGALLDDPRVRKLSFTGSTATGQTLLRAAAAGVISCSMELGGNAPFLVFPSADLDAAVKNAMVAKLRNSGQSCTAANRFYVHESVVEEFTSRLSTALADVIVGNGFQPTVEMGPLINEAAHEKVTSIVGRAIDQGARTTIERRSLPEHGFFYAPTLLSGVSPEADILRVEIFGPVAPVVSFSDTDEAVRLANDSDMGLVSFVQSGDLGEALNVAERLECGMVGINRGVVSDPAAPFGGSKHSGLGREGGLHGLDEYLEPKYIAASW